MARTTFSGPVKSDNGFEGNVAATVLTVSGVGIYAGAGAPTLSAPQGSLYLRTDGSSTSTRAYINTNGTTGWTAITTAS